MITPEYLQWFKYEFDEVQTLTWCSTEASPEELLIAYGVASEDVTPINMTDHDPIDFRVAFIAGRIGSGVLVVDRYGCDPAEKLPLISTLGPCLSARWHDFSPDEILYAEQGEILLRFNPRMRDEAVADLVYPSVAAVDSWIASTPGGSQAWDNHWPTALLETAESLLGASVDQAWVETVHPGVVD